MQVSWAPTFCSSHPSTLLFCTSTLKTRSEELGWGWLKYGTALCLQTFVHAKSEPLASSEDQRQKGQASFQWEAKPALPITEWPRQGRWPWG